MHDRTHRRLTRLGHALLIAAMVVFASACWMGPWPESVMDEASVGFLYVGPVGDHGWTKAHAWAGSTSRRTSTTSPPTTSPA